MSKVHRRAMYGFGATILFGGLFFYVHGVLPNTFAVSITEESEVASSTATHATSTLDQTKTPSPKVSHIKTPDAVKAIYMTSCAATTSSFREYFMEIFETTEINSVVINIKDESGKIAMPTEHPLLAPAAVHPCFVHDMRELVDELHERDIYVIGRIQVFQDPFRASRHPEDAVKRADDPSRVWTDRKGISWLDAGSEGTWEYVAVLMQESYDMGFDEINLDYVRFPSDGDMSNVWYPYSEGREKADVLEEFFVFVKKTADEIGVTTSADLFGLTTTHTGDLNIGQVLERALPYFDAIAPMVYPSHYPSSFLGYANPAEHPYEIINYAMTSAVNRTRALYASSTTATSSAEFANPASGGEVDLGAKLRPWIQDFDLGADYDADMVRTQIQATYDVGLDSWMIWSPSNRYTIGALETR